MHHGRAGLAEFAAAGLSAYIGAHNVGTNHAIDISGDVARTRSYLIAAHVLDADNLYSHADGAGWYDCELRRTYEGWRLTHVTLKIRYLSGEPMVHSEASGAAGVTAVWTGVDPPCRRLSRKRLPRVAVHTGNLRFVRHDQPATATYVEGLPNLCHF
ncbi:nuclear transport factor 2 family protein [Nocardia aurea]|uniref:nuclear transport factor 2 family protein n=1 Tax=Nocardia aurea TaxID=2144174 RepID=UPI0013004D51|nr:nuclear transport factor 2 family protein [Nocardia aurea]